MALTYAGDLLVAVAGPDGSSWSYAYDASSRLSTKTDPLGHATTYGYDALGRLVSSSDPEGNTKTVAFSPENATTVLTEKDGGGWTYRYDAHLGVLLSKTDPQGNTRSYVYDGSRNLLSETDPQGGVNRYSYDSAGNTLSATDAAGNVTAYTYNAFNQTASLTDAEGKTTAFTYDDRGNLTATTDAAGGTTRQEYDAAGNVVRRISALGAATLFTYDASGNLASITDPTGAVTGFAYDLMGNFVRRTDPNGATTLMTYDVRGRLTSVTDQTGGTTSFAYDAAGNRISQTDQNGRVTRSEYDVNGRLSRLIDPAGGVTTYVYGSSGCPSCTTGVDRLIAVTDPNGRTTRYEYDLEGRRIAEIDALGNTVRYAYDSLGNLVSRTDAEARTTSYAYDVLSRRTGVTDAMGGAMQTVYAPTGLVTGVTDPNGVTTAYEYDAAGRLTRILSPDSGNTALTYNADGTLKSKTDANGTVVNYFYDASDRLMRLAFPDPAQDISYGYDAATSENGRGRLTSMTDPSGMTVYHYDAAGRIVREVRTVIGVNYTTRYEYDAAGNHTAITYPSGRTVRSVLDARNRPTAVTSTLVSTQSLASDITYDPAGNPVALTLGNGIPPAWGYDGANRVASITIPGIAALTYAYDLSGNILSITDSVHVESSKSYAYDALDRLIDASGPWGGLMWSYDGNGNRLTQDGATGYAMYGYQGNRLTSETVGAIQSTYTYDAAGNTMSDDRRAFVYDQNQRLMQVRIDGDLAGEYVYDGKGRRVIKRTGPAAIVSSSPQNMVYHYDLAGRLIEETATDGKLLVDYVYLEGRPLAMIHKQSTGEETFFYHDDHLGSPMLMTDKLGKVVWNVAMDPFGNVVPQKGRHGSYIRNVENNLRFPGQYYDAETGLHQNWHRDYDPSLGRYLEADPIGVDGGSNHLFGFNANNPLARYDFNGLLTVHVWTYRGSKEAWGHASMTLADGTHISWWPSGVRYDEMPFLPKIYTAEPNEPQTFADDVAGEEGRAPDIQVNLGCLKESDIKTWWLGFKGTHKWKTLSQNCSTTVADGLKSGGAEVNWSDIWTRWNIVWTPGDVAAFSLAIKTRCEAASGCW